MILISPEPDNMTSLAGPLEHCYFCNIPTKMWNTATNQPVCRSCAKKHEQHELPLSHPDYVPPLQRELATEPKRRKLIKLLANLTRTAKDAGIVYAKYSAKGILNDKLRYDTKMKRIDDLTQEIISLALS